MNKLFIARLHGGDEYVVEADSTGQAFRVVEAALPDSPIVNIREVQRGKLDRVVKERGVMLESYITVLVEKRYPVWDEQVEEAVGVGAGNYVLVSVGPDGYAHRVTSAKNVKGVLKEEDYDPADYYAEEGAGVPAA